jgi:hypothetical protein
MTIQELDKEITDCGVVSEVVKMRLIDLTKWFAASQVERIGLIQLKATDGEATWNEAFTSVELQKQAILKELQ